MHEEYMSEPKQPDESPDESLAAVPPKPIDQEQLPRSANIALGTIALTMAGAGAIVLIGGSMTPAIGATRSMKLVWEQRQLQMDQAERETNHCDVHPGDSIDAQPNSRETN
jgi:hypothetical protein